MTDRWIHDLVAAQQRREQVRCVDHELNGIVGRKHVFATCTKCGARFKVKIIQPAEAR